MSGIDYGTVDSLANYWLRGWELDGDLPAQANLELSAQQALYMLLMSRPDIDVDVCERVLEIHGFQIGMRLATAIIADPHCDPRPIVQPQIDDAVRHARECIAEEREYDTKRARESKA